MLELFVEHLVGRGEVPSSELKEKAAERKIPIRSLQHYAKYFNVVVTNKGFPRTTFWRLDHTPVVPETLEVLSLGAGVQSTTLALMACWGQLHLDAAVFSDTGWEGRKVYEHFERLEKEFEKAGIPLHKVSNGHLRDDVVSGGPFASMPLHTTRDGKAGLMRRQCTSQYKVRPIKKKMRDIVSNGTGVVPPGASINQWIGFSTDEIFRVNDRKTTWYVTNRYPLLEMNMSRQDCKDWLAKNGWGSTPRSACLGCPFHGNDFWRDLKENSPEEWEDVVRFDKLIRKGAPGAKPLEGEAFLHFSRVPLELADLGGNKGEDPDGCSPYGCRSGHRAGTF